MNLLFDIGNSRIKWSQADHSGLQETMAIDYQDDSLTQELEKHILTEQTDGVFVASVRGEQVQVLMNNWCQKKFGYKPKFAVVSQEFQGLKNGYRKIEQLGIDRWLAMLSARQRYKQDLLVVSCGTAITLDTVYQDGEHDGGLILPGLKMMQSALQQTDGIGAVKEQTVKLPLQLGRSTETGVINGSLMAIVSTIERVIDMQRKKYNKKLLCIITGGAAVAITPHLDIQYEYNADLVLQGLRYWSEQV